MGIKGFRGWFESQFPDAITALPKIQPEKKPKKIRKGEKEEQGQQQQQKQKTRKSRKQQAAPDDRYREKFDHVLVDMNQFLHTCVRKSKSDGHCLTLLMKELDGIVAQMTPTKSLVLAMDGPASAAKMGTQRKRRYSICQKVKYKLQQLEGFATKTTGRRVIKPAQISRKKRRLHADERTLMITTGTDFMLAAESAILYWAWQRLSSRYSALSNVKIFLSPSTCAGEGEVKLLEWINRCSRKGETICMLGGDSDLVLEALCIPTASTHNVFVMLPDGNSRYLAVSVWECTRTLANRLLNPVLTAKSVMKVRTDLVLILIFNGNDYLPRLRGFSGFTRLFKTYLRVKKEWHEANKDEEDAFLVDPDSLRFNLPFCIEFFGRLARMVPIRNDASKQQQAPVESGMTHLQHLNNLVDAGFLPGPLKYKIIREGNFADDVDGDSDEDASKEDCIEEDGNSDVEDGCSVEEEDSGDGIQKNSPRVLLRLSLGVVGSDDFYSYELWHPSLVSLKKTKQNLARMAHEDLMGGGGDDDEEDDELMDDEFLIEYPSTETYEWEIRHAVAGEVDSYLYGLLWNLLTYQDGVCANYAYNYGKRLSPSALEIQSFFQAALQENRIVDLCSLSNNVVENSPGGPSIPPFTPPASPGLCCLAALPSKVKNDLVPAPYKHLPDETVESIYASCMNPENNIFDMLKFERLCKNEIKAFSIAQPQHDDQQEKQRTNRSRKPTVSTLNRDDGCRRVMTGDHHWTVLSKANKPLRHPFDPPKPFSDRLSPLKSNNRIRVNHILVQDQPHSRTAWTTQHQQPGQQEQSDTAQLVDNSIHEVRHSEPGSFLLKYDSLDLVPYMTAYRKASQKKKRSRKPTSQQGDDVSSKSTTGDTPNQQKKKKTISRENNKKKDKKGVQKVEPIVPPEPMVTKDGQTALACLKQLEDSGIVVSSTWSNTSLSAELDDPENHEKVRLRVKVDNHRKLSYERDRAMNLVSRKTVKQQLAAQVLTDLVGSNDVKTWSNFTFQELKQLLLSSTKPS